MKTLSKSFTTNKSIVEKYNLNNRFETFSKVDPTKRGRARESMSNAKNLFIRAAIDKIFGSSADLREAWGVGISIFDGRCYICNEKIYTETGEIVSNAVIHADHIYPSSRGGTIRAGNILAAHSVCNNLKGDALVEDFLNDRPEQLAKVRDFQNFYNYSAPDPEDFQKKHKAIVEIYENMMSEVDALMNT